MRNVLMVIVLASVVGCQPAEEPAPTESTERAMAPASLNAVDVEPDISIVEFENDLVRVIRTRRPAGHKSAMHTHMAGVYVSLNEETLGEVGNTFENAGEEHETENTTDSENHGVMVELKVDTGTPVEALSHDAVVVDGEHHTVELENDLVRVVRMIYPEGYATPEHNLSFIIIDPPRTVGPCGSVTTTKTRVTHARQCRDYTPSRFRSSERANIEGSGHATFVTEKLVKQLPAIRSDGAARPLSEVQRLLRSVTVAA